MSADVREIAGKRCLIVAADGPVVRDADGARDLISDALAEGASVIIVPVARLDGAFFQLRSGLAGEVLQKAANYRRRFVVLGDVSAQVAASDALRDFVIECNRGRSICFAPDIAALEAWLR